MNTAEFLFFFSCGLDIKVGLSIKCPTNIWRLSIIINIDSCPFPPPNILILNIAQPEKNISAKSVTLQNDRTQEGFKDILNALCTFWMTEVLALTLLHHHIYWQDTMEKGQKSHEAACSGRYGGGQGDVLCKAKREFKAKAHLHIGALRSFRGADSLCSVSIFTAGQRGRVPWPWKETQVRFSLAVLIKIELLWRCCAITTSDWGADKIASV